MAGDDVRLGRRTLAALVERLERSSRTTIEHLLFKHALNDRFSGGSKLASLGNVFYPLADEDADPDEVGHARELLEEITLDLHQRITGASPWDYSDYDSEQYETMRKALRADGLDLADGRVMIFLTTSVSPAREQGLLERRLADPSFKVASEHLRQAIDNAARGNWESANSQVRSFLESLCEAIAARIFQGSGSPPTHGDARKYLATTGFLSAGESELLHSFFGVLHASGGHAGTSDEDDCHRRRLMAVAQANYYLDRLVKSSLDNDCSPAVMGAG